MNAMARMKRGEISSYLGGILIVMLSVVSLVVTYYSTWQSKAHAQAVEITVDVSHGEMSVVANLIEGELLSIEAMGPGSKLVVDEDVASSSFRWSPRAGDPDGLYRYEIQVVDKATGKIIGRKAGTFTIRGGEIKVPREISPVRQNKRQSMLHEAWDHLAGAMMNVMEFLVSKVEAADVIASSSLPSIIFDDTDDEDCSANNDWSIETSGGANNADGDNYFIVYGKGEAETGTCNVIVPILWINHDGSSGSTNSPMNSMVIDTSGDLRFANNRMFFDRSASRLGIGLTTPSYTLDAVGDRIRIRNSIDVGAKTIQMSTDQSGVVLQSENADLSISALGANRNINLASDRVGVGISAPDSKLHVIGTTPPQFIVQNDAGNARMDFRRSSANGVSQLLFGTGSLSGGTMDYQIGMFLDTVFQIRVTNDSTKGIALTTGGNVGIGNTAPAAKLDVAGVVNASGGFTNVSDVRLKDNIAPIRNALGKVMQTEGISFTWKKEEKRERGFPEGVHYGVIAQQVEGVMPEVVRTAPDGQKAVSYTELVPVLVEAIKEQQGIILNLRKSNDEKDARIKKLERDNEHIVEALQRLALQIAAIEGTVKTVAVK